MSNRSLQRRAAGWLYNHNPFYVLSAVLVLRAVQTALGELKIGEINCWIMTGVLAGYCVVLAGIGVLIVRYGRVWEDARSILLVLLVLFLAVSVGADNLFVEVESAAGGALLLACGYAFSALVAEGVLRGSGIRLAAAYRLPFHLMLATFFVAPWWCSPPLHHRSMSELEWTLLQFPCVAAGLLLTLLPAVRRGPAGVRRNGTPWEWPWFPWIAFGVLAAAFAFRTFILCMAFGPSGPMWIDLPSGDRAIAFDTLWGPYFLVPIALALLVLVLEGSLSAGNARLTRRTLRAAPALLILAWPFGQGVVFRGFLSEVTAGIGSPVWLTVWSLAVFYGVATIRRLPSAASGLAAMVLLLSVVGPNTVSMATLQSPQAWPLVAVGGVCLLRGLIWKESVSGFVGVVCTTAALALILPTTSAAFVRWTTCYHTLAAGIVVLGLRCHDRWSAMLRTLGASQFLLATIVALASPLAADVLPIWRFSYAAILAATSWSIARHFRSRRYLHAFSGQLVVGVYAIGWDGFQWSAGTLGRTATTEFLWGAGALWLAALISAHKAGWLPSRLYPAWGNGADPTAAATLDKIGPAVDPD